MNNFSFGARDAQGKYLELKNSFEEFKLDSLNEKKANHLASDSWNLIEWCLKEYGEELGFNPNHKEKFRKHLIQKCYELAVMHDISNSDKHKFITNNRGKLMKVDSKKGPYSSQYSSHYSSSRLEIHFENGEMITFWEAISKVMDFWEDFFSGDRNKEK